MTTTTATTTYAVVGYSATLRSTDWSTCCRDGSGFATWEDAARHRDEHDLAWIARYDAEHAEPWQYSPAQLDRDLPPSYRGAGANAGKLYVVELCQHQPESWWQIRSDCRVCTPPIPVEPVAFEHDPACPDEPGHGVTVFCPGCFV